MVERRSTITVVNLLGNGVNILVLVPSGYPIILQIHILESYDLYFMLLGGMVNGTKGWD